MIYFKVVVILVLLNLAACINYTNFYEGIHDFRTEHYRDAFIRLKPEAAKGQPDAEYAIGYMYYYGQGVVQNKEQAAYWILKAKACGQPDASQAVRLLKLNVDK